MVLVDTSVLINYFKGNDTPGTRHLEGLMEGAFCITPIILQELLQGSRDEQEFTTLKAYLHTQLFCFPLDPVTTHENAAKIFISARKRGVTIRSSIDCLIAQIAIENKIPLLHDDRDFDAIAKISALKIF